MRKSARPIAPVSPDGMEVIFFYSCPHCEHRLPVASPTQPAMVPCNACKKPFPIIPVDGFGLRFVRIMMNNGLAAVDPDFL